MPRLVVFSAKGGCGASLIAANLAVALARHGPTLLFDLHGPEGTADLLLDLRPPVGWTALLPVERELGERHLQRSVSVHPSGLHLLGAPESNDGVEAGKGSAIFLQALDTKYTWLVVDAPSGAWSVAAEESNHVLLVVTPDPPALRAAQRLIAATPHGLGARTGLVLNQVGRGQPANAGRDRRRSGRPSACLSSLGSTERRLPNSLRASQRPGSAECAGSQRLRNGGAPCCPAQSARGTIENTPDDTSEVHRRPGRQPARPALRPIGARGGGRGAGGCAAQGRTAPAHRPARGLEPGDPLFAEAERLVQAVIDRVLGLGPLEPCWATRRSTRSWSTTPRTSSSSVKDRSNPSPFASAMRPTCAM